jgi:EAL domain-containing protein (putative c-di-GMP-specific phosphodiesterase class I)
VYYFIAEPIYSNNGQLFAVEILTRFTNLLSSKDRESFFVNMSATDKLSIFIEQIDAINKKEIFFLANNVLCTLNIDYESLKKICRYQDLAKTIFSIPHLRIELNETTNPFQINHLNNILQPLRIKNLREFIWLDDFCRARFSPEMYLIWGNAISFIKIDRSLLLNKNYKELEKQIELVKSRNCKVIVEGVETKKCADIAFSSGADYIQGYLFPKHKLQCLNGIISKYMF